MPKYEEFKNDNGEVLSITREDGWSIPIDPANSDYQRYLRWLAGEDDEAQSL